MNEKTKKVLTVIGIIVALNLLFQVLVQQIMLRAELKEITNDVVHAKVGKHDLKIRTRTINLPLPRIFGKKDGNIAITIAGA